MSDLIIKLQDLFQIGECNPIAVRALEPKAWPGRKLQVRELIFSASNFPRVEQRWAIALQQGLALNEKGYNVYTCLNPIIPEFAGASVRDVDIAARKLLLIDLDRQGAAKEPANDNELAEASTCADLVEEWMQDHGHEKAARVMSGNGFHLYYRLGDLSNDEEARYACRSLLRAIASRFDTQEVKVDTSVFNASRITKLPGTIARKGAASEGRPYRRVVFQ